MNCPDNVRNVMRQTKEGTVLKCYSETDKRRHRHVEKRQDYEMEGYA